MAGRGMSAYKILEYWSIGVLGPKAEKDLILFFHPCFPRSKHGSFFSIIKTIHHSIIPSFHYSIAPILQIRLTSSFDKEWRTSVYQQP